MRMAGIILGISAMLAGCASHPESAALVYRQEQLRNQPTVLSSARPAERPEGRGPLEAPPPSETPDLPTAALKPNRHDGSSPGGAEPDYGYSFGRFMMDALAIGVSASIASQGSDCNSR